MMRTMQEKILGTIEAMAVGATNPKSGVSPIRDGWTLEAVNEATFANRGEVLVLDGWSTVLRLAYDFQPSHHSVLIERLSITEKDHRGHATIVSRWRCDTFDGIAIAAMLFDIYTALQEYVEAMTAGAGR